MLGDLKIRYRAARQVHMAHHLDFVFRRLRRFDFLSFALAPEIAMNRPQTEETSHRYECVFTGRRSLLFRAPPSVSRFALPYF